MPVAERITEADLTPNERKRWLEYIARCDERGEVPDLRRCPGGDLWEWDGPTSAADPPAAPPAPANPAPAPVVRPTTPEPASAPYTSRDLTGEDVRVCRKFPMPGGKHLFVFPLSGSELVTLSKWSARIPLDINPGDSQAQRAAKVEAITAEARSLQVILACYQDDRRERPCFELKDAENILRDMRGQLIAAICQISDELGGEGVEQGTAGPGDLRAFFSRARTCCEEWLSASGGWAACPPGLKETTAALISQWPPSR